MASNKVSVHNFTVWEFISQLDAEQSMTWEFTPLLIAEMEKRADNADISVLFFGGCANFLAVYAQTN